MTLFDPDAGVAAALCLIARTVDPTSRRTTRHPTTCGWCDYETAELDALVRGFVAWAQPIDRANTWGRHEVRAFADLPKPRQAELVTVAQAFPEPSRPATVDEAPRGGGIDSSAPSAAQDRHGRHVFTPSVAETESPTVEEEIPWLA